jgi:hypothetical protein
MHRTLQRRVITVSIAVTILTAILVIPLMTNPELRLDAFREAGWVPRAEGELVAGADSGATLVVLPTIHRLEVTDRPEQRFLAAYITRPDDEGMRFEPIHRGSAFVLPIDDYDLISSSPDGSEIYVRGDGGAALVDVPANRVVKVLAPDEAPDVEWDWSVPVWSTGVGPCDRVSNTQRWIACFQRPVLASYLAGDWHLSLQAYGNPDESYDITRGLGSRPILGFSADDRSIYVYNEHGIRRFGIDEAVEG